jgi:hypothetical protein
MGTPQALYVENLDSDNFVLLGSSTQAWSATIAPIKLYPKDSSKGINWGWIPWRGPQVTASADTAACDIYYELFEA